MDKDDWAGGLQPRQFAGVRHLQGQWMLASCLERVGEVALPNDINLFRLDWIRQDIYTFLQESMMLMMQRWFFCTANFRSIKRISLERLSELHLSVSSTPTPSLRWLFSTCGSRWCWWCWRVSRSPEDGILHSEERAFGRLSLVDAALVQGTPFVFVMRWSRHVGKQFSW